jgi:hypothetical protein
MGLSWRRCCVSRRTQTRMYCTVMSCAWFLNHDGQSVRYAFIQKGAPLPLSCGHNHVGMCVQSSTTPQWIEEYLRGAGMEMYTETLSTSFINMTFPDTAAYVCLTCTRILPHTHTQIPVSSVWRTALGDRDRRRRQCSSDTC